VTGQQAIYESPDGGKTVYVRTSGSTDRTLYSQNLPPRIDPMDGLKTKLTYADWVYANRLAEQNPALQEAIDSFILLYNLVKNHG
jgi:hypothetical protein